MGFDPIWGDRRAFEANDRFLIFMGHEMSHRSIAPIPRRVEMGIDSDCFAEISKCPLRIAMKAIEYAKSQEERVMVRIEGKGFEIMVFRKLVRLALKVDIGERGMTEFVAVIEFHGSLRELGRLIQHRGWRFEIPHTLQCDVEGK